MIEVPNFSLVTCFIGQLRLKILCVAVKNFLQNLSAYFCSPAATTDNGDRSTLPPECIPSLNDICLRLDLEATLPAVKEWLLEWEGPRKAKRRRKWIPALLGNPGPSPAWPSSGQSPSLSPSGFFPAQPQTLPLEPARKKKGGAGELMAIHRAAALHRETVSTAEHCFQHLPDHFLTPSKMGEGKGS